MEMYFLKSAACLAVLLLFYKLLLEEENMHVFKRFYLLKSVVAAIAIPLVTFTTYVEPASGNLYPLIFSSEASPEIPAEKINYWPNILFGIYFLGVLFFSIKFFRNLRSLIIKIRKNPKVKYNNFINVLLSEKIQPHTFFSFIFFNKEKFLQDEIPQDVKIHEEAHARQKHSLDVIFVELLQIIFWFNPLIFLLKDAIKLNHEFLADRAFIKKGIGTSGYQQILLTYSSGNFQSDLVNPINYSLIKKRFTVMKTETSRKTIWVRTLLLLPVVAGLLYGFSTKEVVEKEIINVVSIVESYDTLELRMDEEGILYFKSKIISLSELEKLDWENYVNFSLNAHPDSPQENIQELIQLVMGKKLEGKVTVCSYGESEKKGDVLNELFQQVPQKIATPEMVAEYNKLVNYYNSLPREDRNVKQDDAERILFILNRMSPEQKEKAEKINFDISSTPPVPPAPKVDLNFKIVPAPPTPPTPPMHRKSKEDTLHPVPFKWIKNVSPPAPPAVGGDSPQYNSKTNSTILPVPPAPPVPPKPEEHFKELAKEGATFYYGDKEITASEAIELVKQTKNLSIHVTGTDGKKTVRITRN